MTFGLIRRAPARCGAALLLLIAACSDDPVSHPVPQLVGATPDTVVRGTGSLLLQVSGSDFVDGSEVLLDTVHLETSFESNALLTAVVPAAEVERLKGWRYIRVVSPAPGGGTSEVDSILVKNPLPIIDSIRPITRPEGSPTDTLRFYGHGLYDGYYTWPNANGVLAVQVDTTLMVAEITDGKLAHPGSYALTYVQDGPGGGSAATFQFLIPFPAPTLSAISPVTVATDAAPVPLRAYGTGFRDSTKISFGGTLLPTTFISTTEVRATVPADLFATAGDRGVTVVNPLPGGGTSSGIALHVTTAPPRLSSIEPSAGVEGDTGTVPLIVRGRGFHAGDVVQVAGVPRTTSVLSDTVLQSTLNSADRAAPGSIGITVLDSTTGVTSPAIPFVVAVATPGVTALDSLSITIAAWVSDTARDLLWAAVPASAPTLAGAVIGLDPSTGDITDTLTGFGDPRELALSGDGSFLFVGRADAPEVVRVTLTSGARTSLTMPGDGGVIRAGPMLTLPSAPSFLIVSTMNPNAAPSPTGIFVYDDTVRLPRFAAGINAEHVLTTGEGPESIYQVDSSSTAHEIQRFRVVPDGVDFEAFRTDLTISTGATADFGAGRIFLSTGPIIDAATLTQVGSLPTTGPFALDTPAGRVHVLSGSDLRSYHAWTAAPLGAISVPQLLGGRDPKRWGTDGLAFRTSTKLYFLRSPLIGN